MAKKRGLFAELQRQAAQAEKRRQQAERQRQQAAAHAARMEEHNQRMVLMHAREREHQERQNAREFEWEQRRRATEAKVQHQQERLTEVAALNRHLAKRTADLEGVLSNVSAQVAPINRANFHTTAVHPPFQSRHDTVVAPPPPPALPAEPRFRPPPAPQGLGAKLGGAKKHAAEVARMQVEHAAAVAQVNAQRAALLNEHGRRINAHAQAEATRLQRVNFDRMKYESDCEGRNAAAAQANRHADELLDAYDRGEPDAVRDFIEVCLGASGWPDFMPDDAKIDYDEALGELTIVQPLPQPDVVPSAREYKYKAASDEISSTNLPVTARKKLYRGFVSAAAIRTLAEIFTYDTGHRIATVSYQAVVEGIDPATGRDALIPLVALATDRERFTQLDLDRIEPEATIKHLGGVMSKSPLDLQPAPTAGGIRSVHE
ncbi:hypothetical protein [Allobranchiibius sp. GilTou73]|uniref:hypothetical protein n=1 Tax=Allobranchiibius sp. GilTou73 TaxID=2904523 RepID=UPI001F1D1414|nr:hypothetical protein [Allobranchiibius sp. GilTou73]UIJ35317.1 hypothetical protein LVQ62_02700 [Allobranchiibius sp. GilTou73]